MVNYRIIKFILLCPAFYTPLFCQTSSIFIADKNDGKPIAFANITYLLNDKIVGGNYANENGVATIDALVPPDKIEISCVGYKTKFIPVLHPVVKDTVYLIKDLICLDDVTFSRNRFDVNGWLNLSEKLKKDISIIKSNNYPNASFGITVFDY
jgi:hypothetical protein